MKDIFRCSVRARAYAARFSQRRRESCGVGACQDEVTTTQDQSVQVHKFKHLRMVQVHECGSAS